MKNDILRTAKIELARRSLWYFCQALHPDHYTEDKTYLKELCAFLESPARRKMINMPPRSYKSFTLTLYETWRLGRDPDTRILTVSYNDTVAGRFSQGVRNTIQADAVDGRILFKDIFPGVRIKKGDASMQLWALEDKFFSYKGSGLEASLTGLGCTLGVIDDPIKNAGEAFNSAVLDKHYVFYKDTFLSRVEEGGSIIINHTRWVEDDLCGMILRNEPDQWEVFSLDIEEVPGILPPEEIESKKAAMSPEIWHANYRQIILKSSNNLYTEGFKTVIDIPGELPVMAILDPADKGGDYFAGAAFVRNGEFVDVKSVFRNRGEIIDIEDEIIRWLDDSGVKQVYCEANNVGNYFSRKLKEKAPHLTIRTFHTTANKESRIVGASWWLQQHIRFHRSLVNTPFYLEVAGFKRKFSANPNDDCPDVLTSIYDQLFTKKAGVVTRF